MYTWISHLHRTCWKSRILYNLHDSPIYPLNRRKILLLFIELYFFFNKAIDFRKGFFSLTKDTLTFFYLLIKCIRTAISLSFNFIFTLKHNSNPSHKLSERLALIRPYMRFQEQRPVNARMWGQIARSWLTGWEHGCAIYNLWRVAAARPWKRFVLINNGIKKKNRKKKIGSTVWRRAQTPATNILLLSTRRDASRKSAPQWRDKGILPFSLQSFVLEGARPPPLSDPSRDKREPYIRSSK